MWASGFLPISTIMFKTPPLWWWVDHLSKIGFRINLNKHSLGQVQVLLIRRALPRLSLTGPFPERHIASFQECLAPFHRGHMVSGWLCHRLLGLMSLFLDIPVRLLQMRDFQRWVSSQSVSRSPRVQGECLAALLQWKT